LSVACCRITCLSLAHIYHVVARYVVPRSHLRCDSRIEKANWHALHLSKIPHCLCNFWCRFLAFRGKVTHLTMNSRMFKRLFSRGVNQDPLGYTERLCSMRAKALKLSPRRTLTIRFMMASQMLEIQLREQIPTLPIILTLGIIIDRVIDVLLRYAVDVVEGGVEIIGWTCIVHVMRDSCMPKQGRAIIRVASIVEWIRDVYNTSA
jgi:hypothetical protein